MMAAMEALAAAAAAAEAVQAAAWPAVQALASAAKAERQRDHLLEQALERGTGKPRAPPQALAPLQSARRHLLPLWAPEKALEKQQTRACWQ
jgi:hypothetical protein